MYRSQSTSSDRPDRQRPYLSRFQAKDSGRSTSQDSGDDKSSDSSRSSLSRSMERISAGHDTSSSNSTQDKPQVKKISSLSISQLSTAKKDSSSSGYVSSLNGSVSRNHGNGDSSSAGSGYSSSKYIPISKRFQSVQKSASSGMDSGSKDNTDSVPDVDVSLTWYNGSTSTCMGISGVACVMQHVCAHCITASDTNKVNFCSILDP